MVAQVSQNSTPVVDTPAPTSPFPQAEWDRVAANRATREKAYAERAAEVDEWLDRFTDDGRDVLLPLASSLKAPIVEGWSKVTETDWDRVESRLRKDGNIGLLLGASRRVCWDGDNAAATEAILGGGYHLHSVSPGSLDPTHSHPGGAHTLWHLPMWVPNFKLTGPTTAVTLANGGVIDVLAGPHQVVLPPSVVITSAENAPLTTMGRYRKASEVGYCPPDRDGWLLEDRGEDLVLPLWCLSEELLAYAPPGTEIGTPPPGLEPLAGTIGFWREAERKPRDGESDDELTRAVDAWPFLEKIAAAGVEGRFVGYDRCGDNCAMWLRNGSTAPKSITKHDCDSHGGRVQVWTTAFPGLPKGGYSAIDAYIGLTGGDIERDRGRVLAEQGLITPRERDRPASITPEMFEADANAAESRGDTTVAAALRRRAAQIRADVRAAAEAAGEVFIDGPAHGAPTPAPAANTEEPARMATVHPLFPGGVVPPTFTPTPAPIGSTPNGAAPMIGTIGGPVTAGATALQSHPALAPGGPLAGLRTGKWLNEQKFAPLQYHVPGLVAEGCGLVAGPPKAGKSWLVLSLALAIAGGGSALGCLPCQQRPVFYLALEDGDRRVQARSRQLLAADEQEAAASEKLIGVLDDAAALIPEAFEYILKLEEGYTAVDTIRTWLELHPGTQPFIVVDTLGKARGGSAPRSNASAYQEDYKAVGDLKACVDEVPGAGMLIVHHTRKAPPGKGPAAAADFVEELNGTNGITGAADYIMALQRTRETESGVLAVTGRDVIERTMAMSRDPESGLWTLDGGSIDAAVAVIEAARYEPDEESVGETNQLIIETVRKLCPNPGDSVTAPEIAEEMGLNSAGRLYKPLQRLSSGDKPFLHKPARGRFAPALAYPGAAPVVPAGVAPAVGVMPTDYAPPIGSV